MLKCSFLKNLATLTKYNEARTLKLFFKKTRLEYFPVERLYNIEYREVGGREGGKREGREGWRQVGGGIIGSFLITKV